MLSVSISRRSAERRDDDVGPELANDPDHVPEQVLARPEGECLVRALRVPVVERPREELLPPVQAPRRHELTRSYHAQTLEELRTDQVLSAIAARERQIRGLRSPPPRERRQETGVLVVRMSADQEHTLHAVHLPEQQAGRDGTRTVHRLGDELRRRYGEGPDRQGERRRPDAIPDTTYGVRSHVHSVLDPDIRQKWGPRR